MTVPKRLGLVTAHLLANKLRNLLNKYLPKLLEWLTSEDYAKVVALLACLADFIDEVPKYPDDPPV